MAGLTAMIFTKLYLIGQRQSYLDDMDEVDVDVFFRDERTLNSFLVIVASPLDLRNCPREVMVSCSATSSTSVSASSSSLSAEAAEATEASVLYVLLTTSTKKCGHHLL